MRVGEEGGDAGQEQGVLAELRRELRAVKAGIWPLRTGEWLQTWLAEGAAG